MNADSDQSCGVAQAKPQDSAFPQFRASFAEAANAVNLRAYWVRHLRGAVVERQFEALAIDSLACATDHAAPHGCRVDVMPLQEWRERCAEQGSVCAGLKDAFSGFAAPMHVVAPESSGCGLSDWSRMRCTCGWIGPQRFEHDDFKSTKLEGDKTAHLQEAKHAHRTNLARAVDQRAGLRGLA